MKSWGLISLLVTSGLVDCTRSWESDLPEDYVSTRNLTEPSAVVEGVRTKRIVHGLSFWHEPVSDNYLKVLTFYMVISHSHRCSSVYTKEFYNHFKDTVDYKTFWVHCVSARRDPRCSGALIAPNVVQTACHCLATFYKLIPERKEVNALAKSVWEDHVIVFRPMEDPVKFFNTNEEKPAAETKYYIEGPYLAVVAEREFMYSKKYYVHQKCARLTKRIFSHDFGLIILSDRYLTQPSYMTGSDAIRPTYLPKRIQPPIQDESVMAPTYTLAQAEENWMWANRNQPTCLIVGSGWSKFTHGVLKDLPRPYQIQYLWREMTGYVTCASWMRKTHLTNIDVDEGWILDVNGQNLTYKDLATWLCTFPSTRFKLGYAAVGDDGGPVMCESRYIGVLGSGFPASDIDQNNPVSQVELVHSLNYAPESLAEHRQALLDLAVDKRPILDPQLSKSNPASYFNLAREKPNDPF